MDVQKILENINQAVRAGGQRALKKQTLYACDKCKIFFRPQDVEIVSCQEDFEQFGNCFSGASEDARCPYCSCSIEEGQYDQNLMEYEIDGWELLGA